MRMVGRCFKVLLLFAVALAGCKSGGSADYSFPQVRGRVIAADTHQPLAGVKVRRGGLDQDQSKYNDLLGPPKGAQMIEQAPAVRTDAAGRFVLDSERELILFRYAGWYSVTVSFERTGYLLFETNYSVANISGHTTAGAPVVNAGDILLVPAPR